MLAIDTETVGIDHYHGTSMPFFVTTCDETGKTRYWEWPVDPKTRDPLIPTEDLQEIREAIDNADELVLHNAKFDVAVLRHAFQCHWIDDSWPWDKTQDTLIASHILASNLPHNLTDLGIQYLGVDIEPHEKALEKVVQECRRWCRSHLPDWRIAKEGLPGMPSAKEKTWKFDMWLPRALLAHWRWSGDEELVEEHLHYETITAEYANPDSLVALSLWQVFRAELKSRGLEAIYEHCRHKPRIALKMEERGVSVSRPAYEAQYTEFTSGREKRENLCLQIARKNGYDLQMPKGAANNQSLTTFVFETLRIPPFKYTENGNPSLDAASLDHWIATLAPGDALRFVKALSQKRKMDKALTNLDGYSRFWLRHPTEPDWYTLHPRLNPTGTDTLRWSSSNPNSQNISKKEGFNQRYCFGPRPGREWWSLDAANIELRIPTFVAREEEAMEVFLRPKEPPYFGSYHLLVCSILYPDLFKKYGEEFKTKYESTLYQWVKNGNFLIIYGGQKELADATFHYEGAFDLLGHRFPRIAALSREKIAMARKYGYIETIPNRFTGSERGYPLLCSRTTWGGIKPTTPLNYFVSGSAMDWTWTAMRRSDAALDEWNRREKRRDDGYFMIMQVHDELVFDFPAGTGTEPWRTNLAKIGEIKRLMELGGDDIGVPTPVNVEYHAVSWAEGLKIKF